MNHTGILKKRRPQSGILIYVNSALIKFYSNIQNTVKSSCFYSGFVALRIATGMVEALRYKLRAFGVNLEVRVEVYFDNK